MREAMDTAINISRHKMGSHEYCDKARQAVRDAVRHHRKKLARSVSHEMPRMSSRRSSSSEMSTAGYPSLGAGGGENSRTICRSRSMSPGRARGAVGSPEMGQLTSGSSGTSVSIGRASSADSGLDAISECVSGEWGRRGASVLESCETRT